MIAAQAPEGRFHYSGQVAAYASLSAEGAFVAMRKYFDDGINRVLIPIWLKSDRVIDQRGNALASVVWQDDRAAGKVSPTWAFSMRQEMLKPKQCSIRHDHAQSFHML